MNMRRAAFSGLVCAVLGTVVAIGVPSCGSTKDVEVTTPHVVGKSKEEIGKYIVSIAGCHDCHTPGVLSGKALKDIPEGDLLTGSPLGFNGPWGTSYAPNLRQKLAGYTQEVFIQAMRKRDARPPMPWASLHAMTDDDLAAVYAYVRSLSPIGPAMPDPLPPTATPKQPFIVMVPGVAPAMTGGPASAPASAPAP